MRSVLFQWNSITLYAGIHSKPFELILTFYLIRWDTPIASTGDDEWYRNNSLTRETDI